MEHWILAEMERHNKPGEIMLAVTKTPFSVQMIASLGGDVTPLALSPSSLHISWKGK